MTKKKTQDTEGSENWPLFRNIAYVHALQQEDGSYLVVGTQGDVWEVDEHDFHARYAPVTPNKT